MKTQPPLEAEEQPTAVMEEKTTAVGTVRPVVRSITFYQGDAGMMEDETVVEVILDSEGYLAFIQPTSGQVQRLDFSPKEIRLFQALDGAGGDWRQALEAVEAGRCLPEIAYQGSVRERHHAPSQQSWQSECQNPLSHIPQTYRPT